MKALTEEITISWIKNLLGAAEQKKQSANQQNFIQSLPVSQATSWEKQEPFSVNNYLDSAYQHLNSLSGFTTI